MKNKNAVVTVSLMAGLMLSLYSCGSSSSSSSLSSLSGFTSSPATSSPVPSSSSPSVSSSDVRKESIVFHYHRSDGNYTGWKLWLWEDGKNGSDYYMDQTDDFGIYGVFPIDEWSDQTGLNYILKKNNWEWQTADLRVTYADFPADANLEHNVYIVEGNETALYASAEDALAERIKQACFTSLSKVSVVGSAAMKQVSLLLDGNKIATQSVSSSTSAEIDLGADFEPDMKKIYRVEAVFVSDNTDTQDVSYSTLFSTSDFENGYTPDVSLRLGADYSEESTVFRLWAPTSSSVSLNLYDNGTPTSVSATLGNDERTVYDMSYAGQGVYETTVSGNLDGKYYTYTVTNALGTNETIDPYATACGVNGIRGEIVDFSTTDPDGWDALADFTHQPTSLAVYEMHVADLTSDSSWTGNESYRKRFLGLSEAGTSYYSSAYDKTVATGFDHIKEMNVNAVQLQPIFDQANDEVSPSFNWGYNPLNYNCLEGAYSSNPYDGKVRIEEFKKTVEAYAKAGIEIIMDVVYNHVNSLASSSFNKVVPQYYFRYKSDGTAYNGSGCGNETASERKMMRKFILDSTSFWADEYKLGGFRFDLMGLHDIETMIEVQAELNTDPSQPITVYGEPWTGGTSGLRDSLQAKQVNLKQIPQVGAFNDIIRNTLSGDNNGASAGWINQGKGSAGNKNAITQAIYGQTGSMGLNISQYNKNISQNINYISCHDNATAFDKFYLVDKSSGTGHSENELADMSVLGAGSVFTDQGISFMQGGDEFMRHKVNSDGSINTNSYNAGYPVNAFKYERAAEFYQQMQEYAALAKLKTSSSLLQLSDAETAAADISTSFTADNSCYVSKISDGTSVIYVIANNNYASHTLTLDSGSYQVVVDSKSALSGAAFAGGDVTVPEGGLLVLSGN